MVGTIHNPATSFMQPAAPAAALRAKHAEVVALAQQAAAGTTLTADQAQQVADFHDAMHAILAGTGPLNISFARVLDASIQSCRIRRQAAANVAAAKANRAAHVIVGGLPV